MAAKKLKIIFLITLLILLSACSSEPVEERLTGSNFKFDTMVSLTLIGAEDATVLQDIFDEMDRIEATISAHDEASLVSQFNNMDAGSLQVTDELSEIIERSLYYSQISDGLFDITVFPLVKLWAIGTEDAKVPTEEALIKTLKLVDYKALALNDTTLTKSKDDQAIDLGGIAKGYAADYLVYYLKEKGIENGYLDLGGNLYMMGTKENGAPWVAGIQNPNDTRGDYIATVSVSDKSIVTSGPYERYFEEDGVRYHHIIDTKTGYPVDNGLAGVTIISDFSIDGDALSTTVFAMGLEDGLALLNTLDGIDGMIITSDNEIFVSKGFNYDLTITNSNYKLIE